jgi:hypothetical protein
MHEVAATTCDIPHPHHALDESPLFLAAVLCANGFEYPENLTFQYLMGATPPARQLATQYVIGPALLIFFAQPR